MRIAGIREMTLSWRKLKDYKTWSLEWKKARKSLRHNNKFILFRVISWIFILLVFIGGIVSELYNNTLGYGIMISGYLMAIYFSNKQLIMIDDMVLRNISNGSNQPLQTGDGHKPSVY